jgi:stearoyl-CoA desaturase (Delta-9 desaturase)
MIGRAQADQRALSEWVALKGRYHAHIGWLFNTKGVERRAAWGGDLYKDRVIRTIDWLYVVWLVLALAPPFAVAWAITGSVDRGIKAFVWAGPVRVLLFDQVTRSVNASCHSFGRCRYATTDESRNVGVLGC